MRSLFFALVVLAAAACTPKGELKWVDAPDPVNGTYPLTMDLATPAQDGPRPLLIFFHGGGWNIGSLADHHYREKIKEAASRGYVAATVEYRLADLNGSGSNPRFPWPAQSEDTRCALRYLLSRKDELRIDPARIGTVGHSAGGQLALMAALGPRNEHLDGAWCPFTDDFTVSAVVSYAGPGDLRPLYAGTEGWVQGFITRFLDLPKGTTPEAAPERYLDASPVKYLDGAPDVPVLLIQGLKDTIAPPNVNQGFRDELVRRNRTVELLELEGVTHTLDGDDGGKEADAAMWAWFEARLAPWPAGIRYRQAFSTPGAYMSECVRCATRARSWAATSSGSLAVVKGASSSRQRLATFESENHTQAAAKSPRATPSRTEPVIRKATNVAATNEPQT